MARKMTKVSFLRLRHQGVGRSFTAEILVYPAVLLSRDSFDVQILTPFTRSALETRETENALIANIGPIRVPENGHRTPAAAGTPVGL